MSSCRATNAKPMFVRHEGAPHWYLVGPNGEVVDATAAQFKSPVPYDQGRGKGFLTREPSARAREVMKRLRPRRQGSKPVLIGQCDRLRRNWSNGEQAWQEMIANGKSIDLETFATSVDVSTLLEDGEDLASFVADDADAGAYASSIQGQPVWFLDTGGFEFIFGDPSIRALWGQKKGASMRHAQRHQPTVAVDLDGTIVEERPGWASQGIIGPPLPGAMKALRELEALGWKILVWTARFSFGQDTGSLKARIEQHLKRHGVPFSEVWTGPKPPADFYVDNHAVAFNGDWGEVLTAITGQGQSQEPPDSVEEDREANTGLVDWIESENDFGDDGMGSRRDRSLERAPELEDVVY